MGHSVANTYIAVFINRKDRFVEHPMAEPTPIHEKRFVKKNFIVGSIDSGKMQGRHEYTDPPEVIGETEVMRKARTAHKLVDEHCLLSSGYRSFLAF